LEARSISNANASTRACLGRYDDTGWVTVGVERTRLMLSSSYRSFNFRSTLARRLRGRVESGTAAIIVAVGHWQTILAMTLPSISR
jgi:hypothetical protein